MTELPEYIEEVRLLRVEPGDVVIFRSGRVLSGSDAQLASEMIEGLFPKNMVVVLNPDEEFSVARAQQSPAHSDQ